MGQNWPNLIIWIALQFVLVWSDMRFASVFQDRMVLQREPESAVVFGFDALLPGLNSQAFLSCSKNGIKLEKHSLLGERGNGGWRVDLPPQEGGNVCDITVVNEDDSVHEEISLHQVYHLIFKLKI